MKRKLLGAIGSILLGSHALAQDMVPAPVVVPPAPVFGTMSMPVDAAAPDYRIWGSAEYLLWAFKSAPNSTPLATKSDTPLAVGAGALGRPGTQVVLGGDNLHTGLHSGSRITIGSWLDPEQSVGIEANYMSLANRSVTQ